MRWLIAVAVLVVPACFHPVYERPACSTDGACPSGLTCVAGYCEQPGHDAAADGSDAVADGVVTFDAPIDVEPPAVRTRMDLIGLWEFDETSGATISDTSNDATKVPLTVTAGMVVFGDGTVDGTMTVPLMPNPEVVIQSDGNTHLNTDVLAGRAVTLEAWVMPAVAEQGSADEPAVIAGLSANAANRNISIMQAGQRWLARVRTGVAAFDANGLPDLISTLDITAGAMTHLVVVSDTTQRVLYVDGKADAIDPEPAPPVGWDAAFRMVLGNERNNNRAWAGTFALVAMYDRALTPQLIDGNYRAGPNWKAP